MPIWETNNELIESLTPSQKSYDTILGKLPHIDLLNLAVPSILAQIRSLGPVPDALWSILSTKEIPKNLWKPVKEMGEPRKWLAVDRSVHVCRTTFGHVLASFEQTADADKTEEQLRIQRRLAHDRQTLGGSMSAAMAYLRRMGAPVPGPTEPSGKEVAVGVSAVHGEMAIEKFYQEIDKSMPFRKDSINRQAVFAWVQDKVSCRKDRMWTMVFEEDMEGRFKNRATGKVALFESFPISRPVISIDLNNRSLSAFITCDVNIADAEDGSKMMEFTHHSFLSHAADQHYSSRLRWEAKEARKKIVANGEYLMNEELVHKIRAASALKLRAMRAEQRGVAQSVSELMKCARRVHAASAKKKGTPMPVAIIGDRVLKVKGGKRLLRELVGRFGFVFIVCEPFTTASCVRCGASVEYRLEHNIRWLRCCASPEHTQHRDKGAVVNMLKAFLGCSVLGHRPSVLQRRTDRVPLRWNASASMSERETISAFVPI